jgi:uncharacterized protein YutE (UPF0331/DUF86 family)
MVNPDVLARRILVLRESLAELKRPDASDPQALARDSLLRAAVERWLQVAIEACIDIAEHVIAYEGWTPPESARAAFLTLARHGRIPLELVERLGQAAGLRNVLVHGYVSVDLHRLAATIAHDLDDLRAFGGAAGPWIAAGSAEPV